MIRHKKHKQTQRLGQGENQVALREFEEIRTRKWFITKNRHTNTDIEFLREEILKAKYHCLAFETGKLKELEHVHIYLEYKSARKLKHFKNNLGDCKIEKAKGTHQEIYNYLVKDGKCEHNLRLEKPLKLIKNLYKWQQKVIDIINTEPDDRTVNWFWSDEGGKGKTQLCKLLAIKHNALIIGGRYGDIMNGLHNYSETTDGYPSVVVMNLSRDNQKVSYSGLESLKDGLCVNTKFKVGQHIFNSPHVLVFANVGPDTSRLSDDRWNIVKIR